MSMINKIKKKYRDHSGMTLAEVLIAVVILMIATAVIATCIRLGTSLFHKQKRISDAQMLLDALTVSVQDELRYATGIHGDSAGFTYSSRNRAGSKGCTIGVDDTAASMTKGYLCVISGSGSTYELVSKTLYDNFDVTFTGGWDSTNELFTIQIAVYEKGNAGTDAVPLTEKNFTVKPLNPDYNVSTEEETSSGAATP